MFLQSLSLINYKNFDQADLKFSPGINCFIGNNGAGKTNLLDSIYYLSFCKSYINPIDSQNIKHNSDFFVIEGHYQRGDSEEKIVCGVKKNQKKKIKRNNKEYTRFSDHIGLLPIVMISPADQNLILGGSDERRKYMDGVISQFNKTYLSTLINYNKALSQRNALLKDFARTGTFDKTYLEIWNDQLVEWGTFIHNERIEFINKLLPVFQKYYNYISSGNEEVKLLYQSQLTDNSLKDLFTESLEKDSILQYTTKGIHKDDLTLILENYPLKKAGSQGQQKTYLIALKLAQYEFIHKINNFKPILLLDDIFDKLDALRVKQIINMVSDNTGENDSYEFGQIFITDTNSQRLDEILSSITDEHRLFEIVDGEVEKNGM